MHSRVALAETMLRVVLFDEKLSPTEKIELFEDPDLRAEATGSQSVGSAIERAALWRLFADAGPCERNWASRFR